MMLHQPFDWPGNHWFEVSSTGFFVVHGVCLVSTVLAKMRSFLAQATRASLGFASDFQARIQCGQGWIPLESCGRDGGVEIFSDAITSAGDMAASLAFAAGAVERGKPSKSRHFFTREGFEFWHPNEQGDSGALGLCQARPSEDRAAWRDRHGRSIGNTRPMRRGAGWRGGG